jgi:hypothetical protein
MNSIMDQIENLSRTLARKHAEIIENECQAVMHKFNCHPEDLIIEYHDNTHIFIKVKGSEFVIQNLYTVEGTKPMKLPSCKHGIVDYRNICDGKKL